MFAKTSLRDFNKRFVDFSGSCGISRAFDGETLITALSTSTTITYKFRLSRKRNEMGKKRKSYAR